MGGEDIVQTIIQYRYWILVPLSMMEGPIVAFAAGMLASLGYFNITALGVFFLLRDIVMDGLYYSLGHFGGHTKFARRMLKEIGMGEGRLEHIRAMWEERLGLTMFIGKLSYGIAPSFVVFAGAVNLPLRKFFSWSPLVAITQFWTLLALGYFFGATFYDNATDAVQNVLYAVGGITLLASMYYLASLYARKHLRATSEKRYPHSPSHRPTSLRIEGGV